MASGVAVNKDCMDAYDELKAKHMHSYVIFKLSDDLKEVVVHSRGAKGKTYEEFKNELLEASADKQGRYAVFDFRDEETKKDTIAFFLWSCDDTISVKQKMLYASSKMAFKQKLNYTGKEIQANDLSELEERGIRRQVFNK